MTPERWQKIEELFQAALTRPADDRADFLRERCADDAALRAEVDAMLAAHEGAGSFLAAPALEIAAESIAARAVQLTGQLVLHYRIIAPLGAGGMGEVYLAEDTRLGRKVALKFLPAYATSNQERVRRFRQEARAASALSHPNIAHIYEIGESEGAVFIALEYIEGQTLAAHIADRPLSIEEIVDIATQVADALDEAHAHGITHRDIKAANIMLTLRGRVKVLDFGLAKVMRAAPLTDQPPEINTRSGVVMGTVSYMSPEQAMGHEVDTRTDIWSLGVVLYEMATGRLPFNGDSTPETIDRIAHAQPEAIARFNYDVPPELEVIIKKALRKNREDRYQTARDLLSDLKSLKHELEFDARPVSTDTHGAVDRGRGRAGAGAADNAPRPSITAAITPAQSTNSAAYIIGEIRQHKRGALALLALLLLAAGIAVVGIYKLRAKRGGSSTLPNMKVTRLTASGKVGTIDLSPDGKYITYSVAEDEGRESLWIKQVLTGGTLELILPADANIRGTSFSRDGTLIYYVATSKDYPSGALYQMLPIGGPAKRLLADIAGPVALAPDGSRLAFVRTQKGRSDLVTAKVDGTDERTLAVRGGPDWFATEGPAWSPDGRTIACGGGSHTSGNIANVFAVDAVSGSVRPLTPQTWAGIFRVAWVGDGSALVLLARDAGGGPTQVWKISVPGGEATRITNDLSGHGMVSLGVSADAATFVTAKSDTFSTIWVLPADGDVNKARQVTTGADREDGHYGLAWTPDARVVYTSTAGGFEDIWVTNADGTKQQQLTADSHVDSAPAVSRDGRYIVFKSERKGDLLHLSHLWRMDVDGSNLKQLTDANDHIARWSPDSRWVVYSTGDNGGDQLWRVPVDGGAPERLSDLNAQWPDVSPDGKLIVCALFDEHADQHRWRIALLPFDGGAPVKIFDFRSPGVRRVHWRPDGRALVYLETSNGVSNLWSQPLDGSPPTQLTHFKSDLLFHFDFSPDGKWLACSRGATNSDAIMISNFR